METKQTNGRLDIRRCSDEGVGRLVDAILKNAISEWNTNAKIVNKEIQKKSSIKDKAVYELKSIIDFVQSDLFVMYTNGDCPQRDCVDGLIAKITNRAIKEELMNYALTNELKWRKLSKSNEIRQLAR